MSTEAVSASLLAITASVGVFDNLLPQFSDVRKSLGELDMANDVRMGEVAAFALVVGIGVTATILTRSPIPATVSILSAAVLVLMYETALQTTPKEMRNA